MHGRRYFNGNLLRLEGYDVGSHSIKFYCRPVSYENVCRTSFCLDARESKEASSLREQIHRDGTVGTLDKSELANALGVNCILLTADNRLVMPMRSRRVVINPNLLSPSYSGDFDFTDVPSGGAELRQVHILREGFEELAIRPGEIEADHIQFLGLARDLLRGGKPSLYFSAKTNLSAQQLLEKHKDAHDRWEFSHRFRNRRWKFWDFSNVISTDHFKDINMKDFDYCIDDLFKENIDIMSMPLIANVVLWRNFILSKSDN